MLCNFVKFDRAPNLYIRRLENVVGCYASTHRSGITGSSKAFTINYSFQRFLTICSLARSGRPSAPEDARERQLESVDAVRKALV